ncbi:MAG: type II secretion system F family protein [Blautia caecimuris]
MWVHIVIFILAFGTVLISKAGWIHLDALGDKKGVRLFLAVAVCGNFLGMAVTMTGEGGTVQPDTYRIPREETGSYEKEYLISVDGEESEALKIQVPEKETEEQEETVSEKESPESIRQKEFQEMLDQYNQQKQDPDYYYLPSEWKGHRLEWERPKEHTGELLASLGLFAAFVVLLKSTREKQEEEARRAEQLLMDYPGMVMKFALLIQAGMTARSAFRKMADDYERRKTKRRHFAYEAVAAVCYEMDSGVSEPEAYRRFGEKCGQMKYKTFSTLLIQNLQKGSRRMADILEQEALEAWDERKRKARVLGEAAATKLLVPMVMMLAVVMAIIMIPAFLSFYG